MELYWRYERSHSVVGICQKMVVHWKNWIGSIFHKKRVRSCPMQTAKAQMHHAGTVESIRACLKVLRRIFGGWLWCGRSRFIGMCQTMNIESIAIRWQSGSCGASLGEQIDVNYHIASFKRLGINTPMWMGSTWDIVQSSSNSWIHIYSVGNENGRKVYDESCEIQPNSWSILIRRWAKDNLGI